MTKLEKDFEFSRDSEDYEPSDHYLKVKRKRPMVTNEIVAEAIEEGRVEDYYPEGDGDGPEVAIHYEWLNSEFRVVLIIEKGLIKTAYDVESPP